MRRRWVGGTSVTPTATIVAAEAAEKVEPLDFWMFLVAPSPEVYAEIGRMAREKLLRYWPMVVASIPLGLARMYGVSRNYPSWFYPVEVGYHTLLYSLMLLGIWSSIKNRKWQILLVAGIPILYVTGLTMISQVSAMDTRMRSPISVPIIIFAVYGLNALYSTVKKRRQTRYDNGQ